MTGGSRGWSCGPCLDGKARRSLGIVVASLLAVCQVVPAGVPTGDVDHRVEKAGTRAAVGA